MNSKTKTNKNRMLLTTLSKASVFWSICAVFAINAGCEDTVLNTPNSELIVSSTRLDFGDLGVKEYATKYLELSAAPGASVIVSDIRLSPENTPFSIDKTQFAIPSGGSELLEIYFNPQEIENFTAELLIRSDADNAEIITVKLLGRAVIQGEEPIRVTPKLVNLIEGETASVAVSLSGIPQSDLVVAVSSTNTAALTVSPQSLLFTAENWQDPQFVAVAAIQDADVYNEEVSINFETDRWATVEALALIDDDDPAVIEVTESQFPLPEGTERAIGVSLAFQPRSDLEVKIQSQQIGAVTTIPDTLIFTRENYAQPQDVRIIALQDVNTANENVIISLTSPDADRTDVTAAVQDDDTQKIELTPNALSIPEGTSGELTVELAYQPEQDVTIGFAASNPIALSFQPTSIRLTPTNYNVPQVVKITAADDLNVANESHAVTAFAPNIADATAAVIVPDTDIQSIVLDQTALNLVEGRTQDIAISLAFEPSSTLTVNVQSSDSQRISVQPTAFTFTPTNYATPQVLQLVGANDSDLADESITITASRIGLRNQTIAVSYIDDDQQQIQTSTNTITMAETSSTSVTVRLAFEPPTNTIVTVISSAPAGLSVQPSQLNFTPQNYDQPQSLQLNALDDPDILDIQTNVTLSSPGAGNHLVDILIEDDDRQRIVTNLAQIALDEGSSQLLSVNLSFQPAGDVSIQVGIDDVNRVTTSSTTIVFTPQNFATPQSLVVSALHDQDLRDDQTSVRLSGIDIPEVAVPITISDDDSQVIVANPNNLVFTEGTTGQLQISLGFEPETPTTVSIATDATELGNIVPTQFTFTSTNFSLAQSAFVSSLEDQDTENFDGILRLEAPSVQTTNVPFSVVDDDVLEIVVNPTTVTAVEGNFATFDVSLSYQPTNDTRVLILSTDANLANVFPVSLLFTPTNFNQPQSVTAFSQHDVDMADNSVNLLLTAAGLADVNVPFSITDDDQQTVLATPSSLSLNEGQQRQVNIQLEYQPSAPVTVTLTSNNSAATVSPNTINFTPTNFATPIAVTVSGINDDNTIDEAVTIAAQTPGSQTTNISVNVIDDDTQSIIVSNNQVTVIEGSSGSLLVSLSQEPDTNFTVTVNNANTNLFSTSPGTVVFTPANYAVPQTVTINALQDNNAVDESGVFTLENPAATPNTISVNIQDDDQQAIVVSSNSVTLTEGTSETLSVSLQAQPETDQRVYISSTDPQVASTSPTFLTFTPANYQTPQSIQINGMQDNNIADETTSVILSSNGMSDLPISVAITDDDLQQLVLDQASLTINEGGSATVFASLAFQPDASISFAVASDTPQSITTANTSLNFSPADYSTPKPITITAIEDLNVASESGLVSFAAGTVNTSLPITTIDNDAQALVIDQTSLTIPEGTSGTIEVNLLFQPSTDITVSLQTSDSIRLQPNLTSLTFTPLNFSSPQTVTLAANQDIDFEDDSATLTIAGTGIPDRVISVSISDDDTQSIVVSPTSLTITEGGSSTIEVSLAYQPRTPVTVAISNTNNQAVSVSSSSLNFTPSDYSTPQLITVTALEDANTDTEAGTITLSSASAPDVPVSFTTNDNDQQTIIVDSTALFIDEEQSAQLGVRLAFAPAADVTVVASVSNSNVVSLSPSTLTFTSGNFASSQFITIDAASDNDILDESVILSLLSPNLPDVNVSIEVIDDDIQSVLIQPETLSINEGQQTAIGVTLQYEPSSPVTVNVTNSDPLAVSLSSNLLTFTPQNYATPQPLNVEALNDSNNIDEQVFVNLSSAGLRSKTATVTTVDDDALNLVVNRSNLSLTEGGASDSFTVQLTQPPSNPVDVALFSSDTTAVSFSPGSFQFTSTNWNTPISVTVAPLDDNDTQDEAPELTITASGLTPRSVLVAVDDDDEQNIVLTPDVLSLTEGDTDTIGVRLAFIPVGTVRVSIDSQDPGALSVSTNELVFTPANFSITQNVTVLGNQDNDLLAEQVRVRFSTSGLQPVFADVSVIDDDSQAIVASIPSSTVAEGGSLAMAVRLAFAPATTTTVSVSAVPAGEVGFSSTTLVFTPTNYTSQQIISISALQDQDVSNELLSLVLNEQISPPSNISLEVIDDDVQRILVDRNSLGLVEGNNSNLSVQLAFRPANDVRVFASPADSTAIGASPGSLLFTPQNYDTPQLLNVTALEDVDSTPENTSLTLSAANTSDETIQITVNDNDSLQIVTDRQLISIPEGSSDTLGIVLSARPNSDVTVTLSSNSSDLSFSTSQLTFTPATYDTTQTISVSAAEDPNSSNENVIVQLSSAQTPDALVQVVSVDNDSQAFVVNPNALNVTEGASNTFSVNLRYQPASDTTVSLTSSEPTTLTLSTTVLVFTPTNYATPQTVSANAIEDINLTSESVPISIEATSIPTAFVQANVTDNDAQSIIVSPSAINVTEGSNAELQIRLGFQPQQPVDVSLVIANSGAAFLDRQTLTFSPTNYATSQVVQVWGAEDTDITDESTTITLASPGSTDVITTVSVSDDDQIAIVATPTQLTINEGTTSTLAISLSNQPSSTVQINVASPNTALANPPISTLIFTPANFSVPQAVAIFAPHDSDTADNTLDITFSTPSAGISNLVVPTTIADDDQLGIIVNPTSLSLLEGGTSETVTVRLSQDPVSDRTISISSADTSAVQVSRATLTFTSTNWDMPQDVNVSALEDLDTLDAQVEISLTSAGLTTRIVQTNVADDDVQSIIISNNPITIVEGQTETIAISLGNEPSSTQLLTVTSPDLGALTSNVNSLTFTPTNYSSTQIITLTGVEDSDLLDESIDVVLRLSDGTIAILSVTVVENDVQSIILNPVSIALDEGQSDWFTARLAYAPTSSFLVNLATSDQNAATVDTAQLTFDPNNYGTPQTIRITAADDDNVEDENINIIASGIGVSNSIVTVSIQDNDQQSFISSASRLAMQEGDNETINIRLAYEPSAPVVTTVSVSDPTGLFTSMSTLTFTTANYNTPQEVTVNALQDEDTQNELVTLSISSPLIGNLDIPVTIQDDDDQALVIDRSVVSITEGGSENVLVSLAFQPQNPVTVDVLSLDPNTLATSVSQLSFSPSNYDTPQQVQLIAQEDANLANESVQARFSANGLPAASVTVSVTDNDTQAIVLTSQSLTLDEGTPATISVRLAYEPAGDVTVSIVSDDPSAAQVSSSTFLFTASNYAQPQALGITALHDNDIADESTNVRLSAPGVTEETVTVVITDDDTQTLIVSPTTLTVNERSSVFLSISLGFGPTSDIDVTLTSADPTAIELGQSSVSFTPTNYQTPQSIAVLALEDSDTLNNSTTITLSIAGLPDESVAVNIVDNDVLNIRATPRTVTLTEGGAAQTIDVNLTRQPQSNVTVNLSVADSGVAALSSTTLEFSPADWNVTQSITVSPRDDNDYLDESSQITLSSAGVTPRAIDLTVLDDDEQTIIVSDNSLNLLEGNGQSIDVRLAFSPVGTATVVLSSSNNNSLSTGVTELYFNESNYNVDQPVIVTAQQDDNVLDESTTLSLAGAGAVNNTIVTVNINDDDTQLIVVDQNPVSIIEGSSANLAVTLAFNPTTPLTVDLANSFPGLGLSATQLTFTESNYQTPQTLQLSALQDLDARDANTQVTLSSIDVSETTTVSVSIADDDTQAIVVSGTPIQLNEGASATVGVRLAFDPVVPTVIQIASSDSNAAQADLSSVVFDSSNYDQEQNVLISAAQDQDTRDETIDFTLTSTDSSLVTNFGVNIADDDTQALIINPVSMAITEGNNQTFTIRLAFEPDAASTVQFNLSNTVSVSLDNTSVEFTPANYDQNRTVVLTANEDNNARSELVSLEASSNIAATETLIITTVDNDTQEILVTPSSVSLSEGASTNVTVSLRFDPVVTTTVTLNAGDSARLGISTGTIFFNSGNYAAGQNITLTANEDNDTRDDSTTVTLSSPDTATSPVIAASINDDDTQVIEVASNSISISEDGSSQIQVRLQFDPLATATVSIGNSNPAAVTIGSSELFFTSANYNQFQTVSVSAPADNNVLDESANLTLSSPVAPSDETVTVTVDDDDTQSIVISRPSVTLTENSTTTVTVRLAFDPSQAAVVNGTFLQVGIASIDLSALAFDSSNYDQPQTITISALDDLDTQNESTSLRFSFGSLVSDVVVSVTDDDEQQIIISDISNVSLNEGETMTFTARLAFDPVINETVTVSSGDVSAASVSANSLVFGTSNYTTPQTVTVTAVQDSDASDETVTINLSGGGAANDAELTITIDDDEVQTIVIGDSSVTVDEGAAGQTTVRLLFPVSETTVVNVSSSNSALVAATTTSFTFDQTNWSQTQTVNFSASHDDDVANNQETLTFSSASINDPQALLVTVVDDDEQALIVSQSSVSIYEITNATIDVQLAFRPVGTTTVSFSSTSTAIAVVAPQQLIFTNANFNVPQVITIAGVGDPNESTDNTSVTGIEAQSNANATITVTVQDVDGTRLVSEEPAPTNGLGSLARSLQPSIARYGQQRDIAIAWEDISPSFGGGNDYDIILRTYDSGVNGTSTTLVSDNANDGTSKRPRIANGIGTDLHIVWQEDGAIGDVGFDDDIIYRHYDNGTLSASEILVSAGTGTDDSLFPDIAVASTGIVHVVWQDDGDLADDGFPDNDIYYSFGTINGGFSAPVVLNSDDFSDGDSVRPRISLGTDDCPHVAWQDDGDIDAADIDQNDDIYYRGSAIDVNGNCIWGDTTLVSTEGNFTSTFSPKIVVDRRSFPTSVWIAWHGGGDVASSGTDIDVFARMVTGSTLGTLSVISEDDPYNGASQFPSISTDADSNVYISWQDNGDINGNGTDLDIFERYWNGSVWTSTSSLVSVSDDDEFFPNTGISRDSDLICIEGTRYVVWDDNSDYDNDGVEDSDIMYRILRPSIVQ
ncbi:MAG: hypothetical protein VYC39_10335 [Myxococcota bacterium]|nr:hypothetical protein [Myxococcota bacterium]